MKRWIIRSFFIGLLLLCVGVWALSFDVYLRISYFGHDTWRLECSWGKIHVTKIEGNWDWDRARTGWAYTGLPADAGRDSAMTAHASVRFFGFLVGPKTAFAIPLWFPSLLSAALLWLAWRKTRSKVMGPAFPVEPAKLIGVQSGKAK